MKKVITTLFAAYLLSVLGCTQTKMVKSSCYFHPRPAVEYTAKVGEAMLSKTGCIPFGELYKLPGMHNAFLPYIGLLPYMSMVEICFKTELTYRGVFGTILRIGYTQYLSGDMSKPTSFEEMTYDRDIKNLVICNTQFQILEVGSDSIRFVLIKTPTDSCDPLNYY